VWVALGYQLLWWMAPSVADDLLRSGIFAPLLRGVHRVRGAPRLAEQYAFAAALRARPDATVTGPLALGLLGVPRGCGVRGAAPTGAPADERRVLAPRRSAA
jgi:hypothetical protein